MFLTRQDMADEITRLRDHIRELNETTDYWHSNAERLEILNKELHEENAELKQVASELGRRCELMHEWMQERHYYKRKPPWQLFRQDMLEVDAVDEWFADGSAK